AAPEHVAIHRGAGNRARSEYAQTEQDDRRSPRARVLRHVIPSDAHEWPPYLFGFMVYVWGAPLRVPRGCPRHPRRAPRTFISPPPMVAARARRGASLRVPRPRPAFSGLPPVRRGGEDGPVRHGALRVPLRLLPGVRREDVPGRRLRGREEGRAGRGRPRGGP